MVMELPEIQFATRIEGNKMWKQCGSGYYKPEGEEWLWTKYNVKCFWGRSYKVVEPLMGINAMHIIIY